MTDCSEKNSSCIFTYTNLGQILKSPRLSLNRSWYYNLNTSWNTTYHISCVRVEFTSLHITWTVWMNLIRIARKDFCSLIVARPPVHSTTILWHGQSIKCFPPPPTAWRKTRAVYKHTRHIYYSFAFRFPNTMSG